MASSKTWNREVNTNVRTVLKICKQMVKPLFVVVELFHINSQRESVCEFLKTSDKSKSIQWFCKPCMGAYQNIYKRIIQDYYTDN